jgi:hypothetical protein
MLVDNYLISLQDAVSNVDICVKELRCMCRVRNKNFSHLQCTLATYGPTYHRYQDSRSFHKSQQSIKTRETGTSRRIKVLHSFEV